MRQLPHQPAQKGVGEGGGRGVVGGGRGEGEGRLPRVDLAPDERVALLLDVTRPSRGRYMAVTRP